MFLQKLFQSVKNAFSAAVSAVKSFFIEPKQIKSVIKETGTELSKTRTIQERFREPASRPKWVKGLFDDYVYGRVKSIDALSNKIIENMNSQFMNFMK